MRTYVAVSLLVALAVAACSSDSSGPSGPPIPADSRCGGMAKVPAWKVGVTLSFSDTGTVFDSATSDTYHIRLHQSFQTTDTTRVGAYYPDTNTRRWSSRVPHGPVTLNDTTIRISSIGTDTFVGRVFTLGPTGLDAGYDSTLVSVTADLSGCTARVDGWFTGRDSVLFDGFPSSINGDTIAVGQIILTGLTADSAAATGGWTYPTFKILSTTTGGAPGAAFTYRVGGHSGPYYLKPGVTVFDSASVSWYAVPVATAATVPRLR